MPIMDELKIILVVNQSAKYDIHSCISSIGEGVPGGTMRGGGSAVRFHDCTNNSAMTQMRDIKDMVSLLVILFCKFSKHFMDGVKVSNRITYEENVLKFR